MRLVTLVMTQQAEDQLRAALHESDVHYLDRAALRSIEFVSTVPLPDGKCSCRNWGARHEFGPTCPLPNPED
jgi:hypothetical protein